MGHRRGTDPTPQGRAPGRQVPPAGLQQEPKYYHSAPGPDARRDGVFFYGYKKRINNEGE